MSGRRLQAHYNVLTYSLHIPARPQDNQVGPSSTNGSSHEESQIDRSINRSPFEAMFGKKMVLAIENGNIPIEEERRLDGNENDGDEDSSEAIKEASQADSNHYPSSEEENIDQNNNNKGDKDENNTDLTALEQRKQEIEVQRAGARVAQKEQAQKMLENSKRRYALVEIGKTVGLPVDPVDRPKIGHANLLGVVMEADNGFYISARKVVFFCSDSREISSNHAITMSSRWKTCQKWKLRSDQRWELIQWQKLRAKSIACTRVVARRRNVLAKKPEGSVTVDAKMYQNK